MDRKSNVCDQWNPIRASQRSFSTTDFNAAFGVFSSMGIWNVVDVGLGCKIEV